MRRIGVERESPFNRAQAGSTLAGQVENAPTAHLQRLGIFPSCLDSPPRKPSCPTLPDGRCRKTAGGASEAKSTRVSTSFRSPLISRSMPAPRYCRIRSICWMPDMQTKFVEADGLRFEVLEQGTGVRLALCLHGFPEYSISWRHQIPVLAGMGWSLTRAAGCLRLPC